MVFIITSVGDSALDVPPYDPHSDGVIFFAPKFSIPHTSNHGFILTTVRNFDTINITKNGGNDI